MEIGTNLSKPLHFVTSCDFQNLPGDTPCQPVSCFRPRRDESPVRVSEPVWADDGPTWTETHSHSVKAVPPLPDVA